MGMPKKGVKQVGNDHCNAHLHTYFTLMCSSTTYHFRTYSFIGSGIILIVGESHIKVKYRCRRALQWKSPTCFTPFFSILLNAVFLKELFLILVCTLFQIIKLLILNIKRDGHARSYRLPVHGGYFKTLGKKKYTSSQQKFTKKSLVATNTAL